MTTDLPPELRRHVEELADQLAQLRRLVKPPPRRWPWVVAIAVGLAFAALTAQSLLEEVPPVLAPITPTGDAAQRLWLP